MKKSHETFLQNYQKYKSLINIYWYTSNKLFNLVNILKGIKIVIPIHCPHWSMHSCTFLSLLLKNAFTRMKDTMKNTTSISNPRNTTILKTPMMIYIIATINNLVINKYLATEHCSFSCCCRLTFIPAIIINTFCNVVVADISEINPFKIQLKQVTFGLIRFSIV